MHSTRAVDVATLFLCGDVMTGRGVDQIFPRSVDPELRLNRPFGGGRAARP